MAIAFIILPAAISALYILAVYVVYRYAFYSDRSRRIDITRMPTGSQYMEYRQQIMINLNEILSMTYEPVDLMSFDGLRLYGKYYEFHKGAPLQIMFHGYKSASAERDFSGGLILCRDAGCNALLVDERAHGMSGGKTITFGVKERRDCLDWARYATKRFGLKTDIFLVGVSMGAAAVLMASNMALPENVVGIIADSAYTSPSAIIRKVISQRGLPLKIIYPLAKTAAKLFGKFDLDSCSAEQSLRNAAVPVLFIHGEADDFVPCEMSRINYEACISEKHLLTVPGAVHGMSCLVDSASASDAINAFIRSHLRKNINI